MVPYFEELITPYVSGNRTQPTMEIARKLAVVTGHLATLTEHVEVIERIKAGLTPRSRRMDRDTRARELYGFQKTPKSFIG